MRRSEMSRWFFAALALFVILAAGGCDGATEYRNSCPRINHVGEAYWSGETLHVGLWLQDLEGDPVDLEVTGDTGETVSEVLGHGVIGLSSAQEYPGQAHLLSITQESLGGSDTLTFVPVDIDGCEGEAATLQVPVP